MNLIDPKGRPIPRKAKPFTPPPENKNFRATFNMPHGKKLVRSTPCELIVLGSMAPDASTVELAIQLKFRDGLVISGGPLFMEIKEADDGENELGSSDDADSDTPSPGDLGSGDDPGV